MLYVRVFVVCRSTAGYGNFTFRMDFYKSGSYLSPYTEYPIQMGLNEYVYVQYSVESGADLVIMAENCRATKFGAFYSWPYYNLIQNGYVHAAERLIVCVKVDNYSGEKKSGTFNRSLTQL